MAAHFYPRDSRLRGSTCRLGAVRETHGVAPATSTGLIGGTLTSNAVPGLRRTTRRTRRPLHNDDGPRPESDAVTQPGRPRPHGRDERNENAVADQQLRLFSRTSPREVRAPPPKVAATTTPGRFAGSPSLWERGSTCISPHASCWTGARHPLTRANSQAGTRARPAHALDGSGELATPRACTSLCSASAVVSRETDTLSLRDTRLCVGPLRRGVSAIRAPG